MKLLYCGHNVEALRDEGLPATPFTTDAHSKNRLIDELTIAIENGQIGLIDDAMLLAELQAYEMERLPGGLYRYSAPSGMHDDTVMALALALRAAHMPRARVREYA